ncbi:hypothetical protein BpHYR1_042616 [Brachionus plicatilis]|uniref:Uncharacterized protein n=1 Tax=Brachionus plicatilis TaxID=10195 RepID=A0A3M7QNQ8_BRAPC|nr:hypothetical protein BpHYR1_042616 [Brachionus plicatilis]
MERKRKIAEKAALSNAKPRKIVSEIQDDENYSEEMVSSGLSNSAELHSFNQFFVRQIINY